MIINGHLVVNGYEQVGKLWVVTNGLTELRHTWEVRDAAVNSGFGYQGKCPAGEYVLGRPIWSPKPPTDADIPYGPVFIPTAGGKGLDGDTRAVDGGIGQHGGGSGLLDPFAPRQGWVVTHGCNRYQNEDVTQLARAVEYIMDHGGVVRWTQVW